MPPDPPKSFCTLHGSSYKRSVPMLSSSIRDVLATPLTFCDQWGCIWAGKGSERRLHEVSVNFIYNL